MTKVLRIIMSTQLLVAAFAEASSQANAQQAELIAPRIAVIKKGPRLSRLGHRSVWNDRYERIGTIADFVVSQEYVPLRSSRLVDSLVSAPTEWPQSM